jgi:hypothetical protein
MFFNARSAKIFFNSVLHIFCSQRRFTQQRQRSFIVLIFKQLHLKKIDKNKNLRFFKLMCSNYSQSIKLKSNVTNVSKSL